MQAFYFHWKKGSCNREMENIEDNQYFIVVITYVEMSRAAKLLQNYLEQANKGEDLSEAKLVITAMLPYFVVEEDFCKLPFEFVLSIFRDSNEKFEKQDAMELIENAAKHYKKDAVCLLSGIDCGHIGPEAAAAILQPLSSVPLIRELLKSTQIYDSSPQFSSPPSRAQTNDFSHQR